MSDTPRRDATPIGQAYDAGYAAAVADVAKWLRARDERRTAHGGAWEAEIAMDLRECWKALSSGAWESEAKK